MLNYSPEQIIALAPDPGSENAGKSLATSSKWQNVGSDSRAVWGECQGSGAKPYQTVIDLSEPAFKCSCPSRKFPCKHALGLFLLVATQPSVSSSSTIPAWAADWLSKRNEQEERRSVAAKRAEEEPDEETLARRSAQKVKRTLDRESKVVNGLKELELWLRDLVRHGIASTQNRPIEYWDQMAARLVDAQASGAARRVRDLTRVPHHGEGWTDQLLLQVSSLFLLLKAYERLDSLPVATQADVRTAIGWTYKEDELPEENLEIDKWIVLGQRITGEENLRVRRTWLWGERLAKGALILEFAVGGQYFSSDFVPGRAVEAELIFYPSNFPQRAILRKRISTSYVLKTASGYQNINELLVSYTDALALNPWIESVPAPLQTVVPVRRGEKWFARDREGRLLVLSGDASYGWKLMALSGGHPITIFGEWNGRALFPISTWADGRYRGL